jgi:hypothetical protein
MNYEDYVRKTIEELKGFNALYKVYAPFGLKSNGDDIIIRVNKLLETLIEKTQNDNREDPF